MVRWRSGIGFALHGVDLGGEAVAAQWYGKHRVAVLALCLAQGRDLHLDIVFLDHGTRPHAIEQLILGDEPSVRPEQDHKDV
jgi:hypothetical protein